MTVVARYFIADSNCKSVYDGKELYILLLKFGRGGIAHITAEKHPFVMNRLD